MKNPLVSIVIPNYNYEKTLPRCLDALVNQTYKNWEIILVDDGSTDNSIEIAEKYPCKIIKTPRNVGVSAARNIGADNSSGEIIFFLDSDVALYNDAIENTVKEFEKNNSIGSVCGIYAKEPLFNDGLIEEYRVLQGHYWRKSSEGYVTAGFFSLGAVKKTVLDEIGGFNEKLKSSEDAELGHRINQKYLLLLTSKVVGYHDDEDNFIQLVRKMHQRGIQRVPFYLHRKSFTKGFETPQRAFGLVFAGLSSMILPLIIFQPYFLVLFLGFFLLFVLLDFGLYRFTLKEKGILFTLLFTGIHWIITVAVFWGFIRGVFKSMIDRKFRLMI